MSGEGTGDKPPRLSCRAAESVIVSAVRTFARWITWHALTDPVASQPAASPTCSARRPLRITIPTLTRYAPSSTTFWPRCGPPGRYLGLLATSCSSVVTGVGTDEEVRRRTRVAKRRLTSAREHPGRNSPCQRRPQHGRLPSTAGQQQQSAVLCLRHVRTSSHRIASVSECRWHSRFGPTSEVAMPQLYSRLRHNDYQPIRRPTRLTLRIGGIGAAGCGRGAGDFTSMSLARLEHLWAHPPRLGLVQMLDSAAQGCVDGDTMFKPRAC